MTGAALSVVLASAFALTAAAVPAPAQDLGQYPGNSLENRYRGIVAANVDSSNGRDELVVDFGAVGVWVRTAVIGGAGDWRQISGANPDWLISVRWDDPVDEEIVGDFGPLGLWAWDFAGYPGVWTQISGINPEQGLAVNDDDDGQEELGVDFGTLGLWRFDAEANAWRQFSGVNPQNGGIKALMWSDGAEQGVWSFPGLGVWNIHTDISGGGPFIVQLSGTTPGLANVAADFGVGGAYDELIMAQPPNGTWLCQGTTYPSVTWHQLSPYELEGAARARIVAGADFELLADFADAGPAGFWLWDYSGFPGTWELLSASEPGAGLFEPFDPDGYGVDPALGDEEVAVDFESQGLWLYDRTTGAFAQLSAVDPVYMVRADFYDDGDVDECLAVDFGAAGLWAYDGYERAWYQLSGLSPD